jgi:hypothetical protein
MPVRKGRLTHSSLQTKSLPVDLLPSQWLALTVLAHPTAPLNTIDGYSILLTPDACETGMDMSISASAEASAQPAQSGAPTNNIQDKGNNGDARGKGRRGLHNFACFQYSDTLVSY